MKVIWMPRARRDRIAQLEHVADENPVAALEQLAEIENQVGHLELHPNLGRTGRVTGTRELVIQRTPFVLVYRVRVRLGRVEVLRLLHGAQRWPAP